MKRIVTLALILVFQIGYFFGKTPIRKHALIVAIGNYEEVTGWKKISSLNDVDLIADALNKQGFANTDIQILRDAEADKEGIQTALNDLRNKANPGDIVVIHFSSHGQQIMDDNRDEIDGYDEAIVAFGAPAIYDKGYEGENHLRDEELGEHLDDIRQKIGKEGDVLVLVDACHSGTATRGKEIPRGGVTAFAPADYKPERNDASEVGIFEKNRATSRGVADLSPMVVISAARADELNYEYNGYGSLSVAFSRSFKGMNDKFSYRTLFSKIAKEMSIIAPKQNPAIEGDIDRLLFGGKVVAQESYYSLESISGTDALIKGGAFTGLNEGTTIKIFASGTTTTKDKEPVSTGTITYADAFTCNATLDLPLDGKVEDFWVFTDQQTFGDVSLAISLGELKKGVLKDNLTTFISGFPLMNEVTKNEDFIAKEVSGKLVLERSQDASNFEYYQRGRMNSTFPTDDGFRTFKKVMSSYVQGKFLKELELSNPDYNIEMRLIPVKLGKGGKVDTLNILDKMDAGGIPQFSTKDTVLIELVNNSPFPVYFNVIDIQPDGVVNPLIPKRGQNAKDFRIGPGQSYTLNKKIWFYPPYGTETFKVFASYQPIDFTPIFMTKGGSAGTRGNLKNELEKLFADSYSMSRGADIGALSSNTDACTFSYIFKIVEPLK
ncbi:MAG: hypothetical protein HKP14_02145 [Bacteroidia bacterium]|nr:hypothetical protein [Bacteroidia bacterium]